MSVRQFVSWHPPKIHPWNSWLFLPVFIPESNLYISFHPTNKWLDYGSRHMHLLSTHFYYYAFHHCTNENLRSKNCMRTELTILSNAGHCELLGHWVGAYWQFLSWSLKRQMMNIWRIFTAFKLLITRGIPSLHKLDDYYCLLFEKVCDTCRQVELH